MEVIIMISQLILGLSFLVGVHELGHMLTAKYFGMRVEKFSIGFPPKLFGFKKGETEYSIGAIPLGGFVKISGMVDESMDTEAMKAEPQPWEFRSKPAWQRLIVMLGGVIVNVITAFIIYIALSWIVGEKYLSIAEVNKYGIVAQDLAKQIGLQTGDKIIAVNDKKIEDFASVYEAALDENASYTIIRNGEKKHIPIPDTLLDQLADKNSTGFISPPIPFKVGVVKIGSNADKAGLKKGDSIIAVNGQHTKYFHLFQEQLKANKNKTITITFQRNKEVLSIQAFVDTSGIIGFIPELNVQESLRTYSFIEAVPHGIYMSVKVVTDQLKAFSKIFKGELKAKNSVGSVITMAQAYGGTWDWEGFWKLTATLSMILAFMNLLPIPALDGGHVMFLMYEIISGRKPSDKFLETAQKIGMAILLSLMIFAISNDAIRNSDKIINFFTN
ncbi:MAG: RIP metalloprotease RseP [Cytophagales bacterium]|nr:RIP metalloprotease RseP [Cytophaga sp.]